MSEILEIKTAATTRLASNNLPGDENSQGPIGEDPGPPYDPPPTGGTEG